MFLRSKLMASSPGMADSSSGFGFPHEEWRIPHQGLASPNRAKPAILRTLDRLARGIRPAGRGRIGEKDDPKQPLANAFSPTVYCSARARLCYRYRGLFSVPVAIQTPAVVVP